MRSLPLVSITTSAYNVAPYLRDAMDCICGQTYKNMEIICIDDGSKDGTADILKEYAEKDDRIKIVVQEKNQGLAVARNLSLELSKGKYILFVDCDDLMDLSLVQRAVSQAESDNVDMVIWDYLSFYDESEVENFDKRSTVLSSIDPSNTVALLARPAFMSTKLYKTKMLKRLGVHFPMGLTRQDVPVHWHTLVSNTSKSIIAEKMLLYRQIPTATTAQKGRKILDIAQIQLEVKKVLDSTSKYGQYKNTYLEQQLNMLYGMYDNVKDELKAEAIGLIREQMGDDQKNYVNGSLPLRRQARWFYKAQEGDRIARLQLAVWKTFRKVYRMAN
ncbi:glycosyltransferase family 2 protein [Bacteroidia bacterium]|nr:glycosyltransferase family 2 protein [Bacteroidia bacterium]